MTLWLVPKAAAIWAGIFVLAFANGALRELLLIPKFGKVPGLTLSGVLLAILIFAMTYTCLPWLGARRPEQLIAIGAGWLILTVIVEFGLGWLQGKPTSVLLGAYALKEGNIWSIVLLVTACAPWLAAKLRGWI